MESPNVMTALAYYTMSSFLDPIQWLICGLCGWKLERIDQAVIAGAAMVGLLFTILAFLYPEGKLFAFPTPHTGIAIFGKVIGAALMTAMIFWLKQRQLNRKTRS